MTIWSGSLLLDGLQELDAVHAGKEDIGNNQVVGPLLELGQGGLGVVGGYHFIPFPDENPLQGFAQGGLHRRQ